MIIRVAAYRGRNWVSEAYLTLARARTPSLDACERFAPYVSSLLLQLRCNIGSMHNNAPEALADRHAQWSARAKAHGVLPAAVAVVFASLPTAVTKLGMISTEEVKANVAALGESMPPERAAERWGCFRLAPWLCDGLV